MSIYNQMDREVDFLEKRLENGEITQDEFNKEMREIRRDYQAAAEEAAQRAYDDEMGRW